MKKHNLLSHKGYPMYQKIKLTNKGISVDKNQTFGDSIVDIVVLEPLEQGDALLRHTEIHMVTDVLESREPRGEHPEGAIFQKVQCSYVNELPQ